MALWTMNPDGRRVRVVPAHRAYAAAMTEGELLTPEDSEPLRAGPRERDRSMGYAVHYGAGDGPLCGDEPPQGCTGATILSPWSGATSAWSWLRRIWRTITITRAGACTAGR